MRTDITNPYVGLRPFDVDESLRFFGRNDQILDLLQQLHQHHFVAVVGSSGCGKSSLLRAGVIPALKAGYLIHDSDQWMVRIMRPGQNPLYNLVRALMDNKETKAASDRVSELVEEIRIQGTSPLLSLLATQKEKNNKNFFLLVDQFEELYRFTLDQQNIARKDEAIDFVNIMLELTRQQRIPFYVVITMRSDFIGDCTQFYGLPEAMNESLFLVPKLNRVQMKMAIEGPARLFGGKLSPALTSRLLNDVGKVEDELPLLQHALMRIWDHEMNVDKSGELDLLDYKFIGGIEDALSKHADEALGALSKEEFVIAKEVFQALTMIDEHGRKTRRPILLSQLVQLTGATEEQVLKILQGFIQDKRSFLIINSLADSMDKVIDISHESLIREWHRLSRWMDEEAESAAHYLRLTEAARLHKENQKDLLTGSELQLALHWLSRFKPTAVWANRYQDSFEESLTYLKTSEEQWIRDQKTEAERKQREKVSKKRQRSLVIGLGALLVIAAIAIFTTFKFQKLNDQNTELSKIIANERDNISKERDSLSSILNKERDLAEKNLKLLEESQGSVQTVLTQISSQDNTNSGRLKEVSQKLDTAIRQSEKDIRRKELQIKVNNEADNPEAILKTLSLLQVRNRARLSPEELVNVFYFLNRTKKEVWNSRMISMARGIIDSLGDDLKTRKFVMGSQATKEMMQFNKYLREIESFYKTKYLKEAPKIKS